VISHRRELAPRLVHVAIERRHQLAFCLRRRSLDHICRQRSKHFAKTTNGNPEPQMLEQECLRTALQR